MRAQGAKTPYESYCYSCQVTFPPDARLCVHCGQRLSRERISQELLLPPQLEDEAVEAEQPRRRAISPVAAVWVVLAVVVTLYRACTGGSSP